MAYCFRKNKSLDEKFLHFLHFKGESTGENEEENANTPWKQPVIFWKLIQLLRPLRLLAVPFEALNGHHRSKKYHMGLHQVRQPNLYLKIKLYLSVFHRRLTIKGKHSRVC